MNPLSKQFEDVTGRERQPPPQPRARQLNGGFVLLAVKQFRDRPDETMRHVKRRFCTGVPPFVSVSAMNKWVSGIAYNCGCRPSVAAKWEENESGGLRMKTGSRSGSKGSKLIAEKRNMDVLRQRPTFHS